MHYMCTVYKAAKTETLASSNVCNYGTNLGNGMERVKWWRKDSAAPLRSIAPIRFPFGLFKKRLESHTVLGKAYGTGEMFSRLGILKVSLNCALALPFRPAGFWGSRLILASHTKSTERSFYFLLESRQCWRPSKLQGFHETKIF